MADEDPFAQVRHEHKRLRAYDEALQYTVDSEHREQLLRMRGLAAVSVLRAAAQAAGVESSDVDQELDHLETDYRQEPVAAWADPGTVFGLAVTVGALVLAATGAAPIAAAVVGDSLVKETVKAFVGTMIASVLTETFGRFRERRLSQSRRKLHLRRRTSLPRPQQEPPDAELPPLTKRTDEVTRGTAAVESFTPEDYTRRDATPRRPGSPDLSRPPEDPDELDPPGPAIGTP
ncbi:hypothetical protein [Nucisporomicrobium flavum]|uniref:hypothetical protein n=1 Tax=Nucisporomicrobium flavum TaxID=2785915 RepID=UPI0018F2DD38|nr:hypothetical protein [Nucisporomicrobium flavum]